MSQIEQLQNELSEATCDLINAVAFASEWQGQAVQLRDRIERALQVLRDAQTWELHSGHRSGPVMNAVPQGGDWAEAETLDEVRKILEGQKQ